MELVANRRPFLYFPLRHHFEQTFHVAHRLRRHGAGRCLDWDTADPTSIAAAIADELRRTPDYLLRRDRRCDPSRHRAQRAVLNRGNDMRAREPDVEGYIERDGIKVGYEVFGSGSPTVLMLPAWSIVPSRIWKAQVPSWRGTTGSSPSTRGGTDDRTARPTRRRWPTDSSSPTPSRCSTPRTRSKQCSCPFHGERLGVAASLPTTRHGCSAGSQSPLPSAASGPAHQSGWPGTSASTNSSTWKPAGSSVQPARLAARLSGDSSSSSCDQCLPEPHSTKQWDDAVGWGTGHRRRDACRYQRRARRRSAHR